MRPDLLILFACALVGGAYDDWRDRRRVLADAHVELYRHDRALGLLRRFPR